MRQPRWLSILSNCTVLVCSGFLALSAQDAVQLPVAHGECTYFGPQRETYVKLALRAMGRPGGSDQMLGRLTEQVTRALAYVPPGSPTYTFDQSQSAGSIDSYIWADFKANGITPAPATTDWEFIRRVTLDLTGRIPTPHAVLSFVADTTRNKRAKLIDQLLASPEWVDKWTMFYGDLFKNTVT